MRAPLLWLLPNMLVSLRVFMRFEDTLDSLHLHQNVAACPPARPADSGPLKERRGWCGRALSLGSGRAASPLRPVPGSGVAAGTGGRRRAGQLGPPESHTARPGGGGGGCWPSELQEKALLVLSRATSYFVRHFAVAGRQRPLLNQTPALQPR